jgi:indole-3-glycerol phosphate synthase
VTSLSGMAAHVARRVERLKKEEPVEALRGRALYARVARDITPALAPNAKIAEIRFADPERGLLVPREMATAAETARRSTQSGGIIAIWTERNFHAGDYSHLEAARAACPEALLIARDVVLDVWQLERIRAAGADAVELMPEVLGPALGATAAAARVLGLAPVVFGPGLTVRAV